MNTSSTHSNYLIQPHPTVIYSVIREEAEFIDNYVFFEIVCGIHLSNQFYKYCSRNNDHKIALVLPFPECGLPLLSFQNHRRYE